MDRNWLVGVLTILTVAGAILPRDLPAETPPVSRGLIRLLNGRSEAKRSQAITALGQDTRRLIESHEAILDATTRRIDATANADEIPLSTFRLMQLLGRIERPAAEDYLIELLDHERMEVAMIAADTLGQYQRFGAIEALKQQVDRAEFDSHYGFRFNLVRALVCMRHPDAIEFLGELEPKLDGQLAHEVKGRLDDITVASFHGDQARFDAWQSRDGRMNTFEPIRLASDSGSRERIVLKPSYYGIPIHAKRLVFVIDCSSSMLDRTYHGTRISEAKRELLAAINALPSDAEFTIIMFNETIRPWRTELIVATDENKAKAHQFVAGLVPAQATNTYEALREAIYLDSSLEAVFLLSDGKPNRGTIRVPAMIVQDITERNRFRHLAINTIGISVGGTTLSFMQQLAERNAGEFRAVQ